MLNRQALNSIDNFLHHTITNNTNKCLEWPFRKDKNGYGMCVRNGIRRAHRIVFFMFHGSIENGMHILHKCDNPSCCNPKHLFSGTHSDNMKDMARKGRAVLPDNKGEKHGKTSLTDKDVITIRQRYGAGKITQKKLGLEYGISRTSISDIIRFVTWKI